MHGKSFQKEPSAGLSRGWGRGSVGLAFLLCAVLGMAQLDTGSISGTVSDQSGGAAPGATVTVRNVATGVTRTLQTNAAGRYDALALPTGSYEVEASLPGFQRAVRSGITLAVGRNAVVDMVLQVGEVTQAITITGEAAQVETTTATVTNLVDERRVLEIPLNNRDLTQLAFQNALVLKTPTGAPGTRNASGGTGDHLSVAGMRGNMNTYLLDGVSNADISGNSQSATTAYSGAETVKEFQVITNNYSAEYQSKPGAIVSAVTKSGTNQMHGSLFEFLRNDNFDAYQWAAKARQLNPVKPEFKRNQFGGSLGGRIIRDKTFYFLSYEGLRERIGENQVFIVPTAAGRRGLLGPNLYDPSRRAINPAEVFSRADFDAGRTPIQVNPTIVPYMNLIPLPGEGNTTLLRELLDPATGLPDGRAEVAGPRNTKTRGDFGAIKIDHQFVDQRKGFLAFTWNVDNSVLSRVDAFPGQASAVGEETAKDVYSARHTSIWTPTVLNEFVFGFTRTEPSQSHPVNEPDWTNFNGVDLRFFRERERMGQITYGNDIVTTGFPRDRSLFFQDFWTIRDNISMTRTDHTLKFGMEINPIRLVMDQVGGSYNGVYN
ncbi:MAG: carboxypeptidase regulatory-like domain-containing protein, partial [Terriglobia bacterium]